MAVIVEIEEQEGKVLKVKTYHLSDEALRDDEESDDWLSEIGTFDVRFDQFINAATVHKLLQAAPLTQKEQAVLRLTYWGDVSDAVIAQILRINPLKVKDIRRNAIRKLRRLARQWGIE